MALELKFDVCQSNDCLSFDFTEQTGIYDGTTNTGGYGTPNTEVADIIAAELVIVAPYFTDTIDLYSQFPDSTGLEIKNYDGTTGGVITDGIYTITYNVYIDVAGTPTLDATLTKSFLFSCGSKCCVDKIVAKLAESTCGCDSQSVKDALLANALYESLLLAGDCGNITAVNNLIARINRICTIKGCGCN